METDLRSRLDIAPADSEWREDQLPREWVPEKRPSMIKHMSKARREPRHTPHRASRLAS